MSEKLTDPNKAAHEIIEVRADGDAVRNDGVVLQAANKNPWYVLATIHNEQAEDAHRFSQDKELAAKNRRAWNGWVCSTLDDDARKARAKATGLTPKDLAPHSKAELTALRKKLRARLGDETAELPDPTEITHFSKTYFSRFLNLEKYVFEKYAYFISSTFRGSAYFSWGNNPGGTKTEHPVRFFRGADFNSAKFKSTTRFTDVQFLTAVPEFHAAEIYDDTLFPTNAEEVGNWPPLSGEVELEGYDDPVEVMDAADQKRAYNRLRLFMNRSLQIDEEQFFHRMEMRCKRETEGWRYRWIYTLFEGVSDYGNSVLRPAGWLFVMWLSGVIAKLGMVKGGVLADLWSIGPAMGWSFANLFSFFGFYRRYFKEVKLGEELNAALELFSGVQTVFGFALVFLLGLGLRNRFRLR